MPLRARVEEERLVAPLILPVAPEAEEQLPEQNLSEGSDEFSSYSFDSADMEEAAFVVPSLTGRVEMAT